MANPRKKLQILGNGNCLYNSMAVAMCYQFLTEAEDGYWHQWLNSKKANQFWGIFARDKQLGSDRITAFKTFLKANNWVERQRLLAEVLRAWNGQLMREKFEADPELRARMAASYEEHIFLTTAFQDAIRQLCLPDKSEKTLFSVVLDRVKSSLSAEMGEELAATAAEAMLIPHKTLLNDRLTELMQIQQNRNLLDDDIKLIKNNINESRDQEVLKDLTIRLDHTTNEFSVQAERYGQCYTQIISTIRESESVKKWFNDVNNISNLLEAQNSNGKNAGTDELVFLAEATGADLKLSKDGAKLDEPEVTIGYEYIRERNAPQVILKQEGAHWNLWVDVDTEEHEQLVAEYEVDRKLEKNQLYVAHDVDQLMSSIVKADSPRENFVSYDYTLFHNLHHQGSAYVSKEDQIKLDEALAKKLQQEEYDAVKRGPGR